MDDFSSIFNTVLGTKTSTTTTTNTKPTSNTGFYVAVGVGILVVGAIIFIYLKKSK